MTPRAPFAERGGPLRGVVDLATGCYPAFLFGGPVGRQVPVFHFHDETPGSLRPRLEYLAENGYRTLTCDEVAAFVVSGRWPGPRSVMLTFDDAWASVYTVAFPLLREHGLRAVVFAIPGPIANGSSWFVTREQLAEMQQSGIVDVQSHTRWHVMMFAGREIAGFVTPAFSDEQLLNRPVVSAALNGRLEFLEPDALGAPLYVRRSRMSDGRRFLPDGCAAERCREVAARGGGADFFRQPGWRETLRRAAGDGGGRFETDEERLHAIRAELAESRQQLNEWLAPHEVRHLALPWGIAGGLTRSLLKACGYETAYAERPLRRRGVRQGDDRYQLMRLNGKFLPCLPGRPRRWFLTTVGAR